jgi:hypothetical protein
MKYFIVARPSSDTPSGTRAFLLSMALYALSSPGSVRSLDDTIYLLSVVVHPSNKDGALEIPDSLVIPIHPEADLKSFLELFQSTVTSAEVAAMQSVLTTARESQPGTVTVNASDLIPLSVKSSLKTRQEMITLGWFPEPKQTP